MKDFILGAFLMLIMLFGCDHTPLKENTTQQNEKIETVNFSDDESLELTVLPYFKSAWSLSRHEDKIEPNNIEEALKIFYTNWSKTYGDPDNKLWDTINDLTITWGHNLLPIKNCYDIHGNHVDEGFASGLTNTKKTIWVYCEDKIISNTSLVHELVHVALWTLNPDSRGDADHEGNKMSGWTKEHTVFIEQVNGSLKARGL